MSNCRKSHGLADLRFSLMKRSVPVAFFFFLHSLVTDNSRDNVNADLNPSICGGPLWVVRDTRDEMAVKLETPFFLLTQQAVSLASRPFPL